MLFHTNDIMNVTNAFMLPRLQTPMFVNQAGHYGIVFLAALVGIDKEEREGASCHHLAKYKTPGALLML